MCVHLIPGAYYTSVHIVVKFLRYLVAVVAGVAYVSVGTEAYTSVISLS